MQDSLFAHPRCWLNEVLLVYDSVMPTALIKVHQWPCRIYPRKAQSQCQRRKKSLVTKYCRENRGYAALKSLVNPVKAAPVGTKISAPYNSESHCQ